MATKITNTDRYPATPDRMMKMMKSKEYFETKYKALGTLDCVWNKFGEEGGQLIISSTRTVPANLPGFVKKIIGENSIITQSEKWTSDGSGGYKCDFDLIVKGAPGGTTGTMRIVPVGATESDWSIDFDIKCPIPLLGKKLEAVIFQETKNSLVKECEFTTNWLKTH